MSKESGKLPEKDLRAILQSASDMRRMAAEATKPDGEIDLDKLCELARDNIYRAHYTGGKMGVFTAACAAVGIARRLTLTLNQLEIRLGNDDFIVDKDGLLN